jgi:Xaa-Pro aminopeptidase
MESQGIDSVFISSPENQYYLSGFGDIDCAVFITMDRQFVLADFRYTERVMEEAPNFENYEIKQEIKVWLTPLLQELKPIIMGIESENLKLDTYRKLLKLCSDIGIRLRTTHNLVEDLRSVKDANEIEFITQSVKISDIAFYDILDYVKPGNSEKRVAWHLEKYLRENGSETPPFPIIVATGSNSAIPHAMSSDRKIRKNEPIILDFGARVNGYASDLTRTIFLEQQDNRFNNLYSIVREAQQAAVKNITAGMKAADADLIARSVIEEAGYGKAFGTALGHGIGLNIHEKPFIGPKSKDILTDGMVFTIEPGIYIPGWGGIRIEDTVIMDCGKIRVLSESPKY